MNRDQIIAVILIGLGLIAGTFLVYRNQRSNKVRESRGGLGGISVERAEAIGDIKKFDIMVSTGDLDRGISTPVSTVGIKFKVGSVSDEIEFLDELQNPSQKVVIPESFSDDENFLFPVNTIYREDGQYFVELVLVNTDIKGFNTLPPVKIGSIYLRSGSVGYPEVRVLGEFSNMMSKEKPVVNILP